LSFRDSAGGKGKNQWTSKSIPFRMRAAFRKAKLVFLQFRTYFVPETSY